MRRLAVIHHLPDVWIPALRAAAPGLDIRGSHPRDLADLDPDWLAEAEALFCWRFPSELAHRMPRLAWIQNHGAGVDHLVRHPGIPDHVAITRADGAFGPWMARYVVGHFLADVQRLQEVAEAQQRAQWSPRLQPEDVGGRKAVVVGYGRIGRVIGHALEALGMEVAGVVRIPREGLLGWGDVPRVLPETRLLVLCAPLTPETRGMVDARLLAQGHPSLTLINVGRGEQVNVPDLLEALDRGRLRHAVLDVFAEEPLPPESPLWGHPQVTVTPHHSGPSTPAAILADILPNLLRYQNGEPVEGAVDRCRGY